MAILHCNWKFKRSYYNEMLHLISMNVHTYDKYELNFFVCALSQKLFDMGTGNFTQVLPLAHEGATVIILGHAIAPLTLIYRQWHMKIYLWAKMAHKNSGWRKVLP